MIFDRATHAAASAFTKPLFQLRAVCVVSADKEAQGHLAAQLKADGAGPVTTVGSDAAALTAMSAGSVDLFFCVLGEQDLREEVWTAILRARSTSGIVLVATSGDASMWSQALSRRFASVE